MSKIKFHWGHGIFTFIVLFIAACVFLIVYSLGIEWNMVEDNYYQKELEYGKKLTKMENSYKSGLNPILIQRNDSCYLQFPLNKHSEEIKASILIYRPSNQKFDIKFDCVGDSLNRVNIPVNKLIKGKYILKLDWSVDSMECYREIDLIIP
jgi:hypothetical protein